MNTESIIHSAATAADQPVLADPADKRTQAIDKQADILSKIIVSGVSMAISAAGFAYLWGWPLALGVIYLLFTHEMGHWFAARQKNVETTVPIFIPFLGAIINIKQKPENVRTMAYICLAGPMSGALGALTCQLAGIYFHSHLFLMLAMIGYLINLFNMIPFGALDGGQVIAAVSRKLWSVGLLLLVGWAVLTHSYIVPLIILIFCMPSVITLFQKKDKDNYYCVSGRTRCLYAAAYVAVTVGLLLAFCISVLQLAHFH